MGWTGHAGSQAETQVLGSWVRPETRYLVDKRLVRVCAAECAGTLHGKVAVVDPKASAVEDDMADPEGSRRVSCYQKVMRATDVQLLA